MILCLCTGRTALFFASNPDVVSALIDGKANVHATEEDGMHILDIKLSSICNKLYLCNYCLLIFKNKNDMTTKRERERERKSETKTETETEGDRETERQRDRGRERDIEKQREAERGRER